MDTACYLICVHCRLYIPTQLRVQIYLSYEFGFLYDEFVAKARLQPPSILYNPNHAEESKTHQQNVCVWEAWE